jgi:hypothetical protein
MTISAPVTALPMLQGSQQILGAAVGRKWPDGLALDVKVILIPPCIFH